MSNYQDYGYGNTTMDHSHLYNITPVIEFLDNQDTVILDLGCGNGSFARQLADKGYQVYGTDASDQGIHFANQLIPKHFFVQDLSSDELPEPLRAVQFNTIISTEVIEHLYDPRSFIRFAKNILVKNGGGSLIVSTPYHGYLKYLALALTGKMDSHLNPLWDGGHIKFFSQKTLSRLLSEEGFKVVGFKGAGRLPHLWKSMVIKAVI